jgi:hypothetical protein
MKLKYQPFLSALMIVVLLMLALGYVFGRSQAGNSGLILAMFPGAALGMVIATCSSEDFPTTRGFLLVPVSALMSFAFAAGAWALVSLLTDSKIGAALIYAGVFAAHAVCYFALLRSLYATQISFSYVWPIAGVCALMALPLLVFKLSLITHSGVVALWLFAFGIGLARKSGRRSARREKFLKKLGG